MCGRFVGFRNIEELKSAFPIHRVEASAAASYNIAPSQQVLAVLREDGENRLTHLHWGLVPSWAKDQSIGSRLINARAETVATKPSFRNAFKFRRCLIPADGFYEWQGKKGNKQPFYFSLPNRRPFAFAGIWETWNARGPFHEDHRSCAIITTIASASVKDVHHRMPAILEPNAYDSWLASKNQDTQVLETILKTHIIGKLICQPVSRQVNTAGSDSPDNIRPLTQMALDFDR